MLRSVQIVIHRRQGLSTWTPLPFIIPPGLHQLPVTLFIARQCLWELSLLWLLQNISKRWVGMMFYSADKAEVYICTASGCLNFYRVPHVFCVCEEVGLGTIQSVPVGSSTPCPTLWSWNITKSCGVVSAGCEGSMPQSWTSLYSESRFFSACGCAQE